MRDASVATIECATAAAVPASRTAGCNALPGWLVPLDAGHVGRARSAVPLAHAEPNLGVVMEVERLYAEAGLAPAWRLARVEAFGPLCEALANRGYVTSEPTCVQIGLLCDAHAALAGQRRAVLRIEDQPFDDWRCVYLGPGFDPADAASRIEILSRGTSTQYAVAYSGGVPVASGALSLYQPPGEPPIASIHGMRTAVSHRRRGFAAAILTEFAGRAVVHCEQWFLQVAHRNLVAQAVYAKLGFGTAWIYDYWRTPKSSA